ncbi:hypothetical protein BH10PSE17_BH10PSE17_11350 [soil metagenome]
MSESWKPARRSGREPSRKAPGTTLSGWLEQLSREGGVDLKRAASLQAEADAFSREAGLGPSLVRERDDQLVWIAATPSQAAKMRNLRASLERALGANGWPNCQVVVKLQPMARPAATVVPANPQDLPDAVVGDWAALHDTLDEGPLRDALTRLLRQRKR